jgi:hypothetical protein
MKTPPKLNTNAQSNNLIVERTSNLLDATLKVNGMSSTVQIENSDP